MAPAATITGAQALSGNAAIWRGVIAGR
jgi:hypothetical protein